MPVSPLRLTDIVRDIESGRTTPEALLAATNERIDAGDGDLGVFTHRAPEASRAEAAAATGPLAGVPFGAKDIFDSFDMPTEHGSPIYRGNRPLADAPVVALARARGAAIIGKTATTEFASLDPTPTRNPHDRDHTPGGSSSGSAAGVAAGFLAGACGTQTGGSVIRPASFCGVAGYKPSFRLFPTVGVKTYSWSLDTVGFFAATVPDVSLLAALISGRPMADVPPADAAGLTIGLYRSAVDDLLEPDMVAAWETAARTIEAAGAKLIEIAEPASLSAARDIHAPLQNFEAAQALFHERTRHRDLMGEKILEQLDHGVTVTPQAYDDARRTARIGRKAATTLFEQADALLVPSSIGPAPRGLGSTGDAMFNKLWTLTGNPCVNVPSLRAANGLPVGLTIVTRFGRDVRALAIAAMLEARLAAG
ncbi:amidase [Aurantimonas sp. A2-1-M11]|uniref:amidase n=1 Tax=Aurantimonas sp. A2-1-M11 TaxID=3113712 RepID=UPI002F9214F7